MYSINHYVVQVLNFVVCQYIKVYLLSLYIAIHNNNKYIILIRQQNIIVLGNPAGMASYVKLVLACFIEEHHWQGGIHMCT